MLQRSYYFTLRGDLFSNVMTRGQARFISNGNLCFFSIPPARVPTHGATPNTAYFLLQVEGRTMPQLRRAVSTFQGGAGTSQPADYTLRDPHD